MSSEVPATSPLAALFRTWQGEWSRTQHQDVEAARAEVRSSGDGRGQGLFACQQFRMGERIMSESPLLHWRSEVESQEPQLSATWIQAQLALLSAEDHETYAALASSPTHSAKVRALAIWLTNALPTGGSGGDCSCAVYRTACRANHSCVANCAHAWCAERQQLTLQAARPISKGEELTINYLGGGGATRRRNERQAALRALGFGCTCVVCMLPEAERMASDARRERVASLSALLARRAATSYEECEAALEELLSLLRAEGVAEAWAHREMVDVMAVGWAAGHREACAAWGERWAACLAILLGDGYSARKKLALLMRGFASAE